MTDELVPMDKLAKIYRKIRTEIETLTKAYDTQVELLKEQQDALKHAMKDQMQALGVTSVNTTQGTVIMSVKTRFTTNDWDSFKKFVAEQDAFDLFERRIHQTNMKVFLEENPGVVPPGLNSNSEYDISVRKPN
jgi:virulence-associated protein VapD